MPLNKHHIPVNHYASHAFNCKGYRGVGVGIVVVEGGGGKTKRVRFN